MEAIRYDFFYSVFRIFL